MERATIDTAKEIFKDNFVGIDELAPFLLKLGFSDFDKKIPEIEYSLDVLKKHSLDYLLVLGISDVDGDRITIKKMRDVFGLTPETGEPCFYNQDWYLKEDFIDNTLEFKWYLIKKGVCENSRAEHPNELISKGLKFPSAILCSYTFFAYYLAYNIILWEHEFVWCSDFDHNEDMIYVAKYSDSLGMNKNGFSIHRHLALKKWYCATNVIG